MPIAAHDPEHQKALAHDQGGSHQVAVDSVASRTAACLNLHQDSHLVMHGVDFVGDPLAPLVAEEHWPPDLLGAMLAALYLIAKLEEPWPQMGQDLVAGQPVYRRRVDQGAGCRYHVELVGPVGRARVTRVVEPLRIAGEAGHQSIPSDTTIGGRGRHSACHSTRRDSVPRERIAWTTHLT